LPAGEKGGTLVRTGRENKGAGLGGISEKSNREEKGALKNIENKRRKRDIEREPGS